MTSDSSTTRGHGKTHHRPPFGFVATTRVAFSDTDAQGIVYYGRYPRYFDLARVEYLRMLGFGAHDRIGGGEPVMRAFNIEYHAPAHFDDLISVYCMVEKIGNTSMVWKYEAWLENEPELLLTSATQVMVNVDLERRRPLPIPEQIKHRILDFEQGN